MSKRKPAQAAAVGSDPGETANRVLLLALSALSFADKNHRAVVRSN